MPHSYPATYVRSVPYIRTTGGPARGAPRPAAGWSASSPANVVWLDALPALGVYFEQLGRGSTEGAGR
jgi:hypothetical protein